MKSLKGLTKRATAALGIDQKRKKRESNYSNVNFLLDLIQNRKWRGVRKVLNSKCGKAVCQQADSSSLTPLGAAVGCNAPFDIIEKILKFHPEAILYPDEYGSTPLHFGTLNNSPQQTIDLILNHDFGKEAVMAQDCNGFTPMHHIMLCLCTFVRDEVPPEESAPVVANSTNSISIPSAWLRVNDEIFMDSIITNSLEMVERLCAMAPECVLLSTKDGETPLDLIQEKRCQIQDEENIDILNDIYYNLLLPSAIQVYKKRKEEWEIKGYDPESPEPPAKTRNLSELSASITIQYSFSDQTDPSTDQKSASTDQKSGQTV